MINDINKAILASILKLKQSISFYASPSSTYYAQVCSYNHEQVYVYHGKHYV